MQGKTSKRYRRRGILLACLVICAAALFAPPAQTDDGSGRSAVYVQTNTAPVNYVQIFDRNHDGTLTAAGRVETGGVGKPTGNPPLGIPFLDSAGSVTLSQNGQLLFVVNAGDNTVSSLRVGPHGLRLADVESSFGSRPVSSTTNGRLLYVLNSELTTANISGYWIGSHGQLTPIPGSVQPTGQPNGGMPAQIQFDASGTVLTVTERNAGGSGMLDTFLIGPNGAAGPPVSHPSSGAGPFGIAFTHRNFMIVSNEHFPNVLESDVSSYDVTRSGEVTPIDTEPANAGGACWNVITNNDKYVLVTSPFTLNINSFRIERNGELTPVNGDSVVATAQGLTLDEALSKDSKYLYVLVSEPTGFAFAQVNAYKVNKDGTITLLGTTAPFEGSASGAAAW
jgi:6-phosphogluconolactonase (cycloisomerase 2 family)